MRMVRRRTGGELPPADKALELLSMYQRIRIEAITSEVTLKIKENGTSTFTTKPKMKNEVGGKLEWFDCSELPIVLLKFSF